MVFTLFLWGISNACIAQETDKDNITLSVKDESVEKVLKRLGKETDFNFFYDPSVLNTVSLDVGCKRCFVAECFGSYFSTNRIKF